MFYYIENNVTLNIKTRKEIVAIAKKLEQERKVDYYVQLLNYFVACMRAKEYFLVEKTIQELKVINLKHLITETKMPR